MVVTKRLCLTLMSTCVLIIIILTMTRIRSDELSHPVVTLQHWYISNFNLSRYWSDKGDNVHKTNSKQCSSVLNHMTKGSWKTRVLTKSETSDIEAFLAHAHEQLHIPPRYQRPDGHCGNITYDDPKKGHWFRAMCDPKGTTPCCFQNKCESKSISQCKCPDCYDMRDQRHAEYSTWTPVDDDCQVPVYNKSDLCRILNGSSIYFAGDSLVRHVYTAMLLLASGDMDYGALRVNTKPNIRKQCKGLLMFTEQLCRLHLANTFKGCNGTVSLSLTYAYFSGYSTHFHKGVQKLANSRSLVFMGIGLHDAYNSEIVINKYIEPLIRQLDQRGSSRPKLLWAEIHAPGILKSPVLTTQSYQKTEHYNSVMAKYLTTRNIPIFSTFNLTKGVLSFDGQHYGRGLNLVKSRMLISYIRELQTRKLWF